jgi:hypothetical protein
MLFPEGLKCISRGNAFPCKSPKAEVLNRGGGLVLKCNSPLGHRIVIGGPTKECTGTLVECPGVGKECLAEIMLIITLVTIKITYFMKD